MTVRETHHRATRSLAFHRYVQPNLEGDVAKMSRLDEWVRERTDALDAGNSTAVIGKGSINPDEAIAFDTTVRAAILTGEESSQVHDLLLLNVTSAPIGVEATE